MKSMNLEKKWLFPLVLSAIVCFFVVVTSFNMGLITSLHTINSIFLSHVKLNQTNPYFAESIINQAPPPPARPPVPRFAYLVSGSKNDLEKLWRTLQALYHPRNYYVVHLDLESSVQERLELASRVEKEPIFAQVGNVHMITKANMVTYRGPTMVANTLHACAILLKKYSDWGVIHRDLKPENFLYANVNENAQLKAIDFGLSIFFEPGQRFGEIVGSPYYMAPEVLRRNYGPEVDVWSAGVILYILLCGVPPFWAETEEGIAHAIVKGTIDFNRDPWPRVSDEAKDLVKGMLDANPYNRFTVEEVLDHHWIQNADKVSNVCLGEGVRTKIKQFTLMNKFKKKVLRVVADNLPLDQVHGIKQMFYMMDTDKNGNLSFQELKDGLHMMGQTVAEPEVHLLMDAADVDGNGMLNCEEFVTMAVHLQRLSNDDHLKQAFLQFDKNKSGFIEYEDLKISLFDDSLAPQNDQVINDIIFDADLDKDGRISYQDFKVMMSTGTDWKMGSRQYSKAMLNALSMRLFKDKSMQLTN